MREDERLERQVHELLADPQHEGHPLREALAALFQRYQDELAQLERLTSISDGYQTVLREESSSLADRYRKHVRHLQRIIRISDHYQKMMREMNETLKVASTHDPLTGLANRRLMLERLEAETAAVRRARPTFSVALLDIDHFKRINDEFGHDVGDTALVASARALTESLRPYDVCARWGGEEFLVLLPATPGPRALAIAERLRERFAAGRLDGLPEGAAFTLSIGVAEHQLEQDSSATVRTADRALYEAKHAGRNKVVAAGTEGESP